MNIALILLAMSGISELGNPFKPLRVVPATMDLREYGLITPPADITFTACGSGAAAVAALAEANILRTWNVWKNHRLLANKLSSEVYMSIYFLMNATHSFKANKGFYCTEPAEYIISDVSRFETLQLNSSMPLHFYEQARHLNPEFTDISNISIEPPEMITAESDYIQPFYADEQGNSLIVLFHTPFFSLSGDESAEDDSIDLMKQYLARGITLIAQVHLGTDKQYYHFVQFSGSEIYQEECVRVESKFQYKSYDAYKQDIMKKGYDERQERIFYVNIVGYGQKKGQDVWIVKFPFGSKFGNLGYMYFPIGNNTLCIEEYIITALPSNIDFSELDRVFKYNDTDLLGLDLLYSIYNLMAVEFGSSNLEQLSNQDRYFNLETFATNPAVIERFTPDATIVSASSASIKCRLTKQPGGDFETSYNLNEINCTADVIITLDYSADYEKFQAHCFPVDSSTGTPTQFYIRSVLHVPDNNITIYKSFYCFPLRIDEITGTLKIRVYRLYMMIRSAFSIESTGYETFALFLIDKTYLMQTNKVDNLVSQQPHGFYYRQNGRSVIPSRVSHLNLIPGFIYCMRNDENHNVCKRKVFDYLYQVSELWECAYQFVDRSHFVSCYGPEYTNDDSTVRKNMTYYGEIRQNVTSCMLDLSKSTYIEPDFVVCPPSYNMNFTSARVRRNDTITNGMYQIYSMSGMLDFSQYMILLNDTLNGEYLMNLVVPDALINSNTFYDIMYPNGQVKTLDINCNAWVPSSSSRAILKCRAWCREKISQAMYICDNLDWRCNANLGGWSHKTSMSYYLALESRFPLIIRQFSGSVAVVGLPAYKWAYDKFKFDKTQISSEIVDTETFSFDPCKIDVDLNVSSCKDILIENVYFKCDSARCYSLNVQNYSKISFYFDYEFVHRAAPERNPSLSSSSQFVCDFDDQSCGINRRDLTKFGFTCDYGIISCRGTTKTTYTYYSVGNVPVDTRSGMSIFTFNSTDYECSLTRIKSFAKEVGIIDHDTTSRAFTGQKSSGDSEIIESRIWADLVCTITSNSAAFARPAGAPNYLVRDSNSVDNILGSIDLSTQDRFLQLVFTLGLILSVALVICVSMILSVWPGAIKQCGARSWNALCCERLRVYNTHFDIYGVPLLGSFGDTQATVECGAGSIFGGLNIGTESAPTALKKGFQNLTLESLRHALEYYEKKLAAQQAYGLLRSSVFSSGILRSDVDGRQSTVDENTLFQFEAEDIKTLFKRKRQSTLTSAEWLNELGD